EVSQEETASLNHEGHGGHGGTHGGPWEAQSIDVSILCRPCPVVVPRDAHDSQLCFPPCVPPCPLCPPWFEPSRHWHRCKYLLSRVRLSPYIRRNGAQWSQWRAMDQKRTFCSLLFSLRSFSYVNPIARHCD